MAATKDEARKVGQDGATSLLGQLGEWFKGRPAVWAARRAKRQARRVAKK